MQETAYEMRMSDWSSDVCSSDLFYRIAGASHLAGGNLIDARIHTTRDGVAIDNFLVQDPLGGAFHSPDQLTRIRKAIEDSLANRHRMITKLEARPLPRSEEHTSELQSLMRISYAVFCLKKKKQQTTNTRIITYRLNTTHMTHH